MTLELYNSYFSDVDLRFARLMTDLSGISDADSLFLAANLVSHFTIQQRNSCVDLSLFAGKSLHSVLDLPAGDDLDSRKILIPDLNKWLEQLRSAATVGKPGDYAPLILDDCKRLFLYRYWEYEQKMAAEILLRVNKDDDKLEEKLEAIIEQLFPTPKTDPDWQKKAAITALTKSFTVISGGPGTGKTHTVTSILALLLSGNPALTISLCAPTGKAAARLQDSIRRAKTHFTFLPPEILQRIPENAGTIHRLLGVRKGSTAFKHNHNNPVISDVVVVDEASMVSLALMSKLMQAISHQTRLILLGDKNQLSSVEAGAVLGDICDAGETATDLSEAIVELKYSYRFEESKGIGEISQLINAGKIDQSLEYIKAKPNGSITLLDLPKADLLQKKLEKVVQSRFKPVIEAPSLESGFAAIEDFKILCSHRSGEYGVDAINKLVEQILLQQGAIESHQTYYKGKAIIIKQNDYNVNLYNGDTGLVWDDERGNLRAYFPSSELGFISVSLTRLPKHQAAYALTIHESQGSEFNEILIVLGNTASPLLSRELLYTAVTRTKTKMEIWADEEILKYTIANKIQRQSGLKDKLTGFDCENGMR